MFCICVLVMTVKQKVELIWFCLACWSCGCEELCIRCGYIWAPPSEYERTVPAWRWCRLLL